MNEKWTCLSHQGLQCYRPAWRTNSRKPGLEMIMITIIIKMRVIHEEENPTKRAQ